MWSLQYLRDGSEVCQAIVQSYEYEVFSLPVTPKAWTVLANQFEQRWNITHAIGALNGKHIAITKSLHIASLYYNNKGVFSIPLLPRVDAEGIFGDSELFNSLEEEAISCPLTASQNVYTVHGIPLKYPTTI